MGIFGGQAAYGGPSKEAYGGPSNWTDKLALLGAALKDASAGGSQNLMGVEQMQAARQKQAEDAAFGQQLGGLIGGQAGAQGGAGTGGLGLNDPRLPMLAMEAKRHGYDLGQYIEILKANQPHVQIGPDGTPYNDKDAATLDKRFANRQNINGFVVDTNDPNTNGQYFPKLPDGVIPNGQGGVGNIGGLTTALGQQEQAQTAGRTRGTMFTVPQSDGSSRLMLGGDFLGGGGGAGAPDAPGAPGAAGGPRLGVSQAPADKAYAEDNAKAASTLYQGMQTAAAKAPSEIAKYQRLGELLDGFEGGKYAPAMKEIASAANSLGFKIDKNLPNKDAAAAITNQLALSLRDPSNGGGMPGAMSDADRNFLVQSVPGLLQTAAGRRQMVQAQVQVLRRNQDVAAKARQWQQRFGRIDKPDAAGKTFQDYLDAYAASHPLFAH